MRISDWSSDVCSSDLGSGPVNSTNSNPSRPRGLSHSVTGLVLCKKSVRSWLCVAAKGASTINAGLPPMLRYRVASLGTGASRMAGQNTGILDKDGKEARRCDPPTQRDTDAHGQGQPETRPGK